MGIERPNAGQQDFNDHISKYIESLKSEREKLQKHVAQLRKELEEYLDGDINRS